MARRAYHRHIDTGRREGDYTITLCGHRDLLGHVVLSTDNDSTTCSKCSAIHFGNKLPPNVATERWDEKAHMGRSYTAYRSVYALMIDGVQRGFICCESGWGAGWTIRDTMNDYDTGKLKVGEAYCRSGAWRHSTYSSREKAAYVAAQVIAKLKPQSASFQPAKSAEVYLAEKAALAAHRKAEDERRRQERIADTERWLATAEAELADIDAKIAALRGINVEAPASAEALAWAIERANEDRAELAQRLNKAKAKEAA